MDGQFVKHLEQVRCGNGQPVPEWMRARLEREYDRLKIVQSHLAQIKKQQQEQLKNVKTPANAKVVLLKQLCGIGMTSSWTFVKEFFWRTFKNRREVASAIGITPMPYQSGDSSREQGISRAGNRRVRAMAIEIAWSWLRFQPGSKLSQWYQSRFAKGGKRMRRVGIVALARRLMIDLWRYLETGVIPEGARLKVGG